MSTVTKGRGNPIPPGVVAVVSNGVDQSTYALYKDHQIVVIQLPLRPDRNTDPWEEFTHDSAMAAERRHQEELQKIHSLLDKIEFGKTNWVYAVNHPKGGYQLVHKPRRRHQVKCHTWARLIPRRDVTFTKFWISDETWHGYWNGHEVGYEDRTIANVDRQMWAYLALQGLDLTYHVYGHLVEDDGTIVGIVQEAHVGRLMQYRDKSIVYDAFARLQQRGLIYCGAPEFCNTHIMDGKVRLTVLYTVWYFPDKQKCKEQGALRHWKPLGNYFQELKKQKDAPAVQCMNRIWERTPQMLPCFGPIPFKISPLTPLTVSEEAENRYRDIKSWLRKTEHSRKRLILLDHEPASSRGGVIRREKAHRTDEPHDASHSRTSRRQATINSYELALLDHGHDASEHRTHRKRAMSVRTAVSDVDSEKTAVDFSSALAINIQFAQPYRLHHKYEEYEFDKDWDTESNGDGTLVISEISSPRPS
ncbi:hypothetical protein DXG01_011102 [Tephrocybe rancida]|nr:hypothetical protein DXG01_011102 [Tephrocybe rancida]